MPLIWIKSTSRIAGNLRTKALSGPFVFKCSSEELTSEAEITIDQAGENITFEGQIDISPELLRELEAGTQFRGINSTRKDEWISKLLVVTRQKRRLLLLIQQEMKDPQLLDTHLLNSTCEGADWSLDRIHWGNVGTELTFTGDSFRTTHELDQQWQQKIQQLLDEKETPLLAMLHLHEAYRISEGRSRWVEATIAAELAIKEVLGRIEPKLMPLLLEVPSPPLDKLYGKVLEGVAGEPSPFRKKIRKGSERRNALAHRPEHENLDLQEIVDYLRDVEDAIHHLLGVYRSLRHRTPSSTRED